MDKCKPSHRGIGECAPLHDLSIDAIDENKYLVILHHHLQHYISNRAIDYDNLRSYPSILFGIETAILSYEACLRGDNMKLFNTHFTQLGAGIPINGLIWMADFETMKFQIQQKLKMGFKCIKIKIGAIDWDKEIQLISQIREHYTWKDIEIRVDANGAFHPDDALDKLQQLAQLDIHSIEQPIRAKQRKALRKLCEDTPIPIALDEELIGNYTINEKAQLLDEICPQYIILKPSLHGGLYGCNEWISLAHDRNIGYWVTSALESDIGLNAIAGWTSTLLQSNYPPSTQHQGLGTGQLFMNNYPLSPLNIHGECLYWGNEADRKFCEEVNEFKHEWHCNSSTIVVNTSGSTGIPKTVHLSKAGMSKSAKRTCDLFVFNQGDTALLCMPIKYIGAKMVAVRAWERGMHLVLSAPSLTPLAHLRSHVDFICMTPLQASETLRHSHQKKLLAQCKVLLLGGGPISSTLEEKLKLLPCAVWSSYGMTETYSHIALRRVNGLSQSKYYQPLPGVCVSLNSAGALIIHDKYTGIGPLETNDTVEILPSGHFLPTGRLDNVVNCGGIKHSLELIENKLSDFPYPFFLTKRPDDKFGEIIVMVHESNLKASAIDAYCRKILNKYEIPKDFVKVEKLPLTENGKPQRWIFYQKNTN